ncbi:MAG TPA: hypothetical protein EYQ31_13555 [Candidatus Handelsmanbacteria bacterium]|nr:hypothetical protein [Candidatus Handelsmanbacteria bacterium]
MWSGVLLLITGGRVDGLQLLPFMPWSTLAAQFDVVSVAGWGAVLFLGLGCSGIAYLCWYASLARASASSVAALLYLEPLVTQAGGVVLLDEGIGPVLWAAG